MIYSPTIAAIMGLNGAHDSVVLKLAKVKCPLKKANFERQELRIMSCLLELLDTLPEQEKQDLLQKMKVEV
ncbi:hypothetical protein SG34_007015 [Thalassomonas viridans]|uniref:Uncharacterized protein n=1 Tax=Thalassomonas viridans TaxID=137584 RepID=A0AAE9Z5Y8_9GAMM|nr:hypothetical protein [Thalassomonas viridans]WDE06650.1 hypothetical protein SG34_007015 [Thalassomonas viridans]